jgi:hypothetical protein
MRHNSANLSLQNRIFKLAVEGLYAPQIAQRLNATVDCVEKFMPVEHPVTGEAMHARDYHRWAQRNAPIPSNPVPLEEDDEDDEDDD